MLVGVMFADLPRRAALLAALRDPVGAGSRASSWSPRRASCTSGALPLALARPVFIMPEFTLAAIASVALPLFVVTMASQNVPGVAVIRASGYDPPISPIITWTGLSALVLAPIGAFTVNLAAITAAITMGEDAHEDRTRSATWRPSRRACSTCCSGCSAPR